MTPTRRQALLMLSGVIAAMTERTRAQEPIKWATASAWKQEPVTLSMDMAVFKEYKFSHKGETIIITPDEMWAALKAEKAS